jgi:cytochrome P450
MPEVPEEFRPLSRSMLRQRIQQIADDLLDRAEGDTAARGERAPDRSMGLIAAFAYPFPVTVICEMLGIPAEDHATVRPWSENLLAAGELPVRF